ncbi:MAG: response regulator transcription factor [Anaerolineales bacterium]|nr:response regulator transcription factor [Anaerolineales bacterium]
MIRVVVVEDHHLVRQGIIKLLESANDLDVVGEADDGTQAIALAKSLRPDVMILDITMPQIDGFQALAEIQGLELKPQVVILSMHADPGMIRQALQGGALGYVIKQSVADELIAAVRAAMKGSIYLSSGISGVITNNFFVESPKNLLDRLSPREREVVRGIVEGHSTRQIAESLRTSVKTVEKQRRDAMRKLEVDNLASLVRVSLELGLVAGKMTHSK